jgi:hypothetical protein
VGRWVGGQWVEGKVESGGTAASKRNGWYDVGSYGGRSGRAE